MYVHCAVYLILYVGKLFYFVHLQSIFPYNDIQ